MQIVRMQIVNGSLTLIDTNEPTNGSVLFYLDDSTCSALNSTILDQKLENTFVLDDFDVWHDLPIDSYTLVYSLANNVSYYYKTELCDNSGNCITSACYNFTTEANESGFSVSFDLPPPQEDVTGYLGSVQVSFDLNSDGVFNESIINSAHGLQFNSSIGRDVDIKFNNPNSTKDWGIYFIGADLLKVINMNITDAFVISESAEGDVFLGMKKNSWKELAQGLGVDYVRIVMPQVLNDITTGSVKHCPDNSTSVDDAGCIELDSEDVNCTFGSTSTVCEIPVNVGFSVFVVEDDYVAPVEEDDSPSSGGGGGVEGTLTYNPTKEKLQDGYTLFLRKNYKVNFELSNESHILNIDSVGNDSVNITISSEPQTKMLSVGDEVKFELDGDNIYDFSVKLNSVSGIVAEFFMKTISEEIPEGEVNEEDDSLIDSVGEGIEDVIDEAKKSWVWIIGIIVLLVAIIGAVVYFRKRQ